MVATRRALHGGARAARRRGKPLARAVRPARAAAHAVENAEVARVLSEMADVLEIQGENPFRIRAYRNAARTISSAAESVAALAESNPEKLRELRGVGADLAGKIVEIVRTGHLAALDTLAKRAPAGAQELMRLPGLGPKRARLLCERLGIRSLADLRTAAAAGRVRELPGFGAKTEERIIQELSARHEEEQRVLRATAAEYGESLLQWMRALPGVRRAELAGSFRRCRETVGDLDLLVTCTHGEAAIERFVAFPEREEVLARGPTKASLRLRSGLQVDLRVLPERAFGAGLHYFTGSKAHNIAVRRLGQKRGLKINEYGVFRGTRWTAGREERDVFAAVDLPWIPPELREDRGEIEAAAAGSLPVLVTLDDIRGDLQFHTTDSDGRDSLDEMAEAAQAMGYEYVAVTDHTPSVRIAGGLDRSGFRRQRRRIERLNARLRSLTVLQGAEVDILPDGSLDLDDATLEMLDVVIVSLHAKLDLAPAAQTARLVRGLAHPAVDVLGHPTGRLIGRRRGASFDQEAVFRAAADNGVIVEVNAQPERLDLDDVSCRAAIEHGLRIAVDTDAHAVAELRFMRWGVDQARRGWATKADVVNTRTLAALQSLLHHGRR